MRPQRVGTPALGSRCGPSQGRGPHPHPVNAASGAVLLEVTPTSGVSPSTTQRACHGRARQTRCSPPVPVVPLCCSLPTSNPASGGRGDLGEVPGKQLSLLTRWWHLISPLSEGGQRPILEILFWCGRRVCACLHAYVCWHGAGLCLCVGLVHMCVSVHVRVHTGFQARVVCEHACAHVWARLYARVYTARDGWHQGSFLPLRGC